MATSTIETERKYEAPPGTPPPDLRGLPLVAAQSTGAELLLDATYYDTASYDLTRAGITLRHRTGGVDAGWHLKVPSESPDTRAELRLPAAPDIPSDIPPEFAELLTARSRGRALRPVATISTRRRSWTLSDEAGEPLAEVAFDEVTGKALDPPSVPSRWSEVEVELADGIRRDAGDRLLKAADRRLRSSGLLRSNRRMKLEAVLADALVEPERESPGASTSAGDVVLVYLNTQLEELLRQDLSVRRAEPDAIHRMRVGARRTRAALREFRRLFRGPRPEHVLNELRWLGEELGAARDEEVLRELLIAQLDELPVESVLGPVRARLGGHFAPRLADAERRVREVLDSPRYLELLDDLRDFIDNPPLTALAGKRAAGVLPGLVRRSQSRVKRRMTAARHVPVGNELDCALHDARKAAKRARYAAEAASLAFGRQPRKSAKALKQLQSTLGDHHDAVIAADALRSLGLRAHAEGESSYTYGVLTARQYARADGLAKRARREWRLADRPERTAWMSETPAR